MVNLHGMNIDREDLRNASECTRCLPKMGDYDYGNRNVQIYFGPEDGEVYAPEFTSPSWYWEIPENSTFFYVCTLYQRTGQQKIANEIYIQYQNLQKGEHK